MRRACRTAVLAALAVASATLAGCVAIPTSGPIAQGSPAPAERTLPIPLPLGPQEGADEEEIVTGFLRAAQAGVFQDYSTARQFLAPRADWDPRAVTLVVREDPAVRRTESGVVLVDLEVAAHVDAAGVYHEAAPSAGAELQFELTKIAGEWRITSVPDGVVFRESAFLNAYTPVPVYFATPDRAVGVPDERWLPSARGSLLLRTVQALLGGPSPWLRDAVVTGLPNLAGAIEDVTGPDAQGVVTIALSSEVNALELPEGARELLEAQLQATLMSSTLRGIPVSGVAVTVRDSPWNARPDQVERLVVDLLPSSGPYAIEDDVIVEVRGQGQTEPVGGLPSLAGLAAHHPAMSLDGDVWVVLDGPSDLVLLPTDGAEPVVLHSGEALLPPSVDRHDWVWTGERASTGVLVAASPEGEVVEVSAPWLAGREIRSIRVSRDGTRVAIASVGPDLTTTIEVASVIRNGAVPQLLSDERLAVGAPIVEVVEIAWLDATTLAVLGSGEESEQPGVYHVPVGGPTTLVQAAADDATGIAAGRDSETVYAVDGAGVLRVLRSASWVEVADGLRDPAFPG